MRDCPDSISRLAVDDVLRRKGRSGAVVSHGLDELGILLGIGLAGLLGTANVVQRDVQVADPFGMEIRFELVKLPPRFTGQVCIAVGGRIPLPEVSPQVAA